MLPRFRFQIVVATWFAIACMIASAHEGHQPLPTKGVQVDVQNGQVTLSAQARFAIGLQSIEVVVGPVTSSLEVYAESITPWHAKALGSARISGLITKLLVRPGDLVDKGQIVAELSSRELETLKLDYLQATNDQSLNQRLLEMTKPSVQTGAVPLQRLLDIENALEQSRNRVAVAKIWAQTLGINLEETNIDATSTLHYPIRSPIAGRILHSDLAEGKYVEAFEHLFDIVNADQVWVRLQLLEKDLFKVSPGDRVKVSFPNNSVSVEGTIEQIDASLDSPDIVSWAWMTVTQAAIVPGLVGHATIYTSQDSEKLTVPRNAVYSDGLQSYVFVEEASTRSAGEYRKKNILLGKRMLSREESSTEWVEVLQGDIYPGDRVVVKGGHELSSLFFLGVLKLPVADQERLGILTAPAGYREIANTVQIPATVTLPPENRSVVSSQLDGTIHSHTLTPGRKVHAGELLMEVASPDFHKLQLDLISASLDADLSRRRANLLEGAKGDAIAMRLVLETRSQAEQSEARVQSLSRQLATLGLLSSELDLILTERRIIDYLPIRAPIDGRIASSAVTLGETVNASQTLAEVQNLDAVWVEAHLPSRELDTFAQNASGTATILANPDIQFPVTLSRIGPVVNESTRTKTLWLSPQPSADLPELRVGTLVTVDLISGIAVKSLAVPSPAILRDGIHHFVFVQKDDGYVERRRVKIGRSDGQHTEIVQGVEEGELVVTTGGRELQTAYASLR